MMRWSGAMEQVAPPPPVRHARLGAYAWWQLRDYLIEKGIGTVVVLALAASLMYMGIRSAGTISPEALQRPVRAGFQELIDNLVLLGVLFASNGIASEDRKHGYYRFLFAKPVSVTRFYAQKFGVHLVGFLLVAVLFVLAFNLVFGSYAGAAALPFAPRWLLPAIVGMGLLAGALGVVRDTSMREDVRRFADDRENAIKSYASRFLALSGAAMGALIVTALLLNLSLALTTGVDAFPFLPPTLFPVLAALFVALGGIGFLMSVVWRIDWLSFMTIYLVSNVLWSMFGAASDWKGTLVKVLPPVHKLGGIYAAVVSEQPLPMDDMRWLLLYGIGCFLLGLVALRARPLTSA